jgi:hypothetical protein
MNIGVLVVIGIIVVLLAIISFLIIKIKQKPTTPQKNDEFIFFDDLMKVVNDKNSTKDDLLNVLVKFNENFYLSDENVTKYLVFLNKALSHKNTHKDIFAYFHKHIKPKNPNFKTELEAIELKSLEISKS